MLQVASNQLAGNQIEIKPQYRNWRKRVSSCSSSKSALERWLFLDSASVLFGQKAGELLTLTTNQFELAHSQKIACMKAVAAFWGVTLRVVHHNEHSTKIIIYHRDMVQKQLDSVPPCILHEELGYPTELTPERFLSEVEQRWVKRGKIPHEIGFALGYPIKDVLGFMNLKSLPCSGCCGWQVYGEFAPSYRLCQAFLHARHCAIRFLHDMDRGDAEQKGESKQPMLQ